MAPFLEWSERYATGIATVDGEHRTLFMMINALHEAVEAGDTDLDLANLFVRLGDYMETHFRREEWLMEAADYPFLKEHMAQHQALNATLERFMNELAGNRVDFPIEDFLDFLRNWLTHHVLVTDMEYVPHVKRAGDRGADAPD